MTAAVRRLKSVPEPRTAFRVVDGNRSPFYAALKRRAELVDLPAGDYRLTLKEQRQLVIPWLRWPYFTYWHTSYFYGHKIGTLEIVVRVFLETGHMPASWAL